MATRIILADEEPKSLIYQQMEQMATSIRQKETDCALAAPEARLAGRSLAMGTDGRPLVAMGRSEQAITHDRGYQSTISAHHGQIRPDQQRRSITSAADGARDPRQDPEVASRISIEVISGSRAAFPLYIATIYFILKLTKKNPNRVEADRHHRQQRQ